MEIIGILAFRGYILGLYRDNGKEHGSYSLGFRVSQNSFKVYGFGIRISGLRFKAQGVELGA